MTSGTSDGRDADLGLVVALADGARQALGEPRLEALAELAVHRLDVLRHVGPDGPLLRTARAAP